MKPNPVTWFEIYVNDLKRAKRFYETVLQTELKKLDSPIPNLEMWQFPSNQTDVGAPGALVKMAGMDGGGSGTIIYFECKDCAVEEKRAVASGGRLHRGKTSIGQYGSISLVYDTEGNMIGLHSM
jgi:predicted enzyme related to lactoylglutathione lyase